MSDKKSAVNDIGPVLTESSSPAKGMLKKKDLNTSPIKKSVTFEEPGVSPAASPPKQIAEAADANAASKMAPSSKKMKNLLITIESVECLYKAGIVDRADPQVTIRFNGVAFETQVVSNNPMPFYHETFSFLVTEDDWEEWKHGKEPAKGSPGSMFIQIEEADYFGAVATQVVRGRREGSIKTILGKSESGGKQPRAVELYQLTSADGKGAKVPAARLVLTWTLSDVIPATHFGNENEGGAYTGCLRDDFRNSSGVLVATIHQVDGIKAPKGQLEVIAQLKKGQGGKNPQAPRSAPDGYRCKLKPCLQKISVDKSDGENKIKLKDYHFQGQSARLFLASEEILQEELSFFVCTAGGGEQVAVFRQPLSHALALVDGLAIDGSPRVVLEAETPGNAPDGSKPKLVVTLSYLNSIYTRKNGKGKVWLTYQPKRVGNNESGPADDLHGISATFKLLDNDENEVSENKWRTKNSKAKKAILPTEELEIDLQGGTIQKLEITLMKQPDGVFANFKGKEKYANFTLCIAELFANRRIAQLDLRHLDDQNVDLKNQLLINIGYTGRFDPTHATDEERKKWDENKASVGGQRQRQKSGADQLVAEKQDAPVHVVTEQKLSPFDYQARDLFELQIPDAPLFAEQPKGVVVLQLQQVNIQWDSGAPRSLYMLISTSREIYRTKSLVSTGAEPLHWGNEIIKINTADRTDQIFFKMYDDSDTTKVLAEGKLSLQMIFVDTRAFQRSMANVMLQVFGESWGGGPLRGSDDEPNKLGQMGVGLMYRCSELTKDPRGRLELSLNEATALANTTQGRDTEECHPAVEFILNDQRVLVKSKLMDATKEGKKANRRSWETNKTYLDTYSALDILQINFYDDKEGTLLGTEYRDVSALFLTSTPPEVQARNKKKQAKSQIDVENFINIDLRRLPNLKGQVSISCRFLPRKTPNTKLDIRNKLREAMLEEQQKTLREAAPRDLKKDACAGMLRPTSGPALCNQVSYIQMDLLQLKNIDARKALMFRHIVIEFTYGKNRHVSRCTLDLGQTRNQECLDDFFRVNLKDLSLKARDDPNFSVFDDHDIVVTAYSVVQNAAKQDVQLEAAESGNKIRIGQCRLQSALLRQALCTELKINCGIGIAGDLLTGVVLSPGAGDEAYAQEEKDFKRVGPAKQVQQDEDFGDDELEMQASGLLTRMGQDLKTIQSLNRKDPQSMADQGPNDPMIALKISVFTTNSRIIRNPMGILSLSNFQLYNSAACLGDLNLTNLSSPLTLSIQSNGVVHTTGPSVEGDVKDQGQSNGQASNSEHSLEKDFCLKSADGRVLQSFLREGKAFQLNHNFDDVAQFETLSAKKTTKMISWPSPAMFNLFCTQALNEIELNLILPQSGGSDPKVISRAELNLADVSLFMDGGKERDTLNLAIELDYQQLTANTKSLQPRHSAKYDLVGFAYEDQPPATNFKNLLGHYYDNKMILTMQVNFNAEIVREARQLGTALRAYPKTISCFQNAFLMPQQVNYKDFISNGYDELVKKQMNLKKQQKAMGGLSQIDSNQKEPHKHVLVDLKFKSLQSLLRQHAGSMGGTSGFLAFEPIHEVKTAVITDYLGVIPEKKGEALNMKALEEQRSVMVRKNIGEVIDSLIVQPQNLLPTSIQLSEVFSFNGSQSQTINQSLKCWVDSNVTKIFVSYISQKGKQGQIKAFREHLSKQPVMQAHNILGIVKEYNKNLPTATSDQSDNSISISQAIIDIEGALNYEKKAPDGSYMRAQSSGQICQNIALRKLDEYVGDEMSSKPRTPTTSLANLQARVATSAFIDCPSGDVDVIIKRISTNQEKIHSADYCIRVKMLSPVPKDKIRVDVSSKGDVAETSNMSQYSNKPTPEDGFNNILINHVSNLVSRHFMDQISIQVIKKDAEGERAIFTTIMDLNRIPIKNKEPLSFTIMATGAQAIKSAKQPVYYKIELDLIFKSRDGSSGALSLLDQAIENYKLMMGKESLTPIEIEILQMLIERQQMGKKLTPSRLKARKAFFFIRRLSRIQYRSMDNKLTLNMKVSPLTYLLKVFSSSSFGRSYDHYRVQHLRQTVEKELQACKPLAKGLKEALERAKRSSGVENDEFINFKEGNLLQVDFKPEGLELAAFDIKKEKIKKLVFMVQMCQAGKPSKTVFTLEYNEKQLEKLERILKGQQVFIPNVNPGVEVKFAIMVVPRAEVTAGGNTSMKAEVLKSQGQPASLYLNEFTDKLKNNIPEPTNLILCRKEVPIEFRVVQNALTRQPHRVIEITFHRLMKLDQDNTTKKVFKDFSYFVDKKQLNAMSSQQSDAVPYPIANKNISNNDPEIKAKYDMHTKNNINLVLAEKECVVNENEVMRAEELAALDDEDVSTDISSNVAKGEQISKGSINDTIQKTAAKEGDGTKYDLFLDFDTCEPFHGVHKGMQKIDINKYGKALSKTVNKFEINNTSASNKIKFKLFRHDSRQAYRVRQFGIGMEASNQGEPGGTDRVEVGQLAEAEINLSHLNNFYINQPQGFVCPVTPTPEEEKDSKSAGYKVNEVYALFAITITDKTFGELILDLNEFRGIPACPAVEMLSWRVLVKPTEAGANAARIRREAQEAEETFDQVKKRKSTQKSDLDSVGKGRIPATYEQKSEPPIKYNMATMGGVESRLTLTREMVIEIKMKDIFSNKSLFMRGGNELYAEFDQRIFIELFASTKMGPKSLIGQLEMSLIDLIRKSIQQEDNKASELRRQKAREEQEASKKEEVKEEEAVSGKSAALEAEQAQRIEQAQRQKQRMMQHRQEMRELKKKVKAGEATPEELKAKEEAFEAEQNAEHVEEAKIKREQSEAASAAGKSKLGSAFGSQRGGQKSASGSVFGEEDLSKNPIPEGFKSVILPNAEQNANEDEKLEYLTGNDRAPELQGKKHPTRLVFRANWGFSFQKREQRTEAYYAHMADLQELERTRERKKIPNMIDALYKFAGEFSGDSAAATRLTDNMTVLSLVLASESASTAMGSEALESHPLLQNVQELLMAFGAVFIRFQAAQKNEGKPPTSLEVGSAKQVKKVEMPIVPSTVALMRCCLYTKIICKNAGPQFLKKFREGFEKARLFPHIIEIFEKKGKESRQIATKTLQFVTYMMYDMPELYFSSLSGVRLIPLLEHVNLSPENRADAELIAHHSKLVNACCHCLFQFEPTEGDIEHQMAIMKSDIRRLGANIYDLVRRLIAGEMNSQFKQTYEDIAMPICDSAVRFIHLSIAKFKILNQTDEDKKDTTLSKVFEALFQIIVDAIASGLSMEFIDRVKKQLNYEIQLISRLGVKFELNLLFDGGDIQSRLKKLLDIYLENQEYNQRLAAGLIEETDFRQDMDQYLATSKPILEFFADEDAMNTLGENNSKQIQTILKDPTCSNSSDFILFLHNVVKADLENEDSVKGEGEQARKQRIKKEKYGGIVNINRFSISHIEWLAEQMPGLIDI